MKIGDFDTDKEILLIAEIGNNHEGNYSLAEEMVGLAARAGAGAVKFQTIVPRKLVGPDQVDRIKQLERLCLGYEDFEKLQKVAERENVIFLSTPLDIESARFLEPLVPAYKIASGDNNFFPLIEVIARTGKPVLLSSGLTDMEEISKTVEFIRTIWSEISTAQEMAVLHCVASYPATANEVNLLAIQKLHELGVTPGYSDHTIGIEAAVLSAAMGARVIEKHFTVDKDYSDFPDHKLAADPDDFKQLVSRVREAVAMMGDGIKHLQPTEETGMQKIRRSVVAGHDMESGTLLKQEDLTWLRPGGGLSPGQENVLIGRKLNKSVSSGQMILPEDVTES